MAEEYDKGYRLLFSFPRMVEDLIRYYRAAPGFLGGSNKKADALERRLREGTSGRTG